MITRTLLLVFFAFGLSACGTTPGDRGLTGAGIGAATGAVVGAVTGLGPLTGAAIGGGVGAAAGALTESRDFDLGKPIWRKGGTASQNRETATAPATPAAAPAAKTVAAEPSTGSVIKDVQVSLKKAGYDPGSTDGRMGAKTRAAIIQYQQANGLNVDGTPSPQLLEHLKSHDA
jgi:osmotically inducible lipoprotein OsmB